MKKVFIVCFVIAAVMMTGLRGGGADDSKAAVANEASDTDPCRPLTVSPGEKFVIELPANRTTGFSWQIAKPLDEKVVKLVESKYLPVKSGVVGAPGKEVWTFTAVAPGQSTISLVYSRPWEKGKPPGQEKTYTVIVR